ncbi:MAG: hypothetical protein LEGION0398_MBIBDBAK_00793 [Legionellaceae bacterium]
MLRTIIEKNVIDITDKKKLLLALSDNQIKELSCFIDFKDFICFDISPTRKYICLGYKNKNKNKNEYEDFYGKIIVYDIENKNAVIELISGSKSINAIAFIDEKTFIYNNGDYVKKVSIENPENEQVLYDIPTAFIDYQEDKFFINSSEETAYPLGLKFTSEHRDFSGFHASLKKEECIVIFNLKNMEEKLIKTSCNKIIDVAMNAEYIAYSDEKGYIYVKKISTLTDVYTFPTRYFSCVPAIALNVTNDNKLIAIVNDCMYTWDINSKSFDEELPLSYEGEIQTAKFISPTNFVVITKTDDDFKKYAFDNEGKSRDINDTFIKKIALNRFFESNKLHKIRREGTVYGTFIRKIEGKQVIIFIDKRLCLHDIKKGTLIKETNGLESFQLLCGLLTPIIYDNKLIIADRSRTVCVFNVDTFELLNQITLFNWSCLNHKYHSLCTNGNLALYASDNVAVLFTLNGQILETVTSKECFTCCESLNNNLFIMGDNRGNIKLFHYINDEIIEESYRLGLSKLGNSIKCITASNDKELIAVSSENGLIFILKYNVLNDSFNFLKTIDTKKPVEYLKFTPDGAYLAAGCSDNKIEIWSIISCNMVAEFTGHKNMLTSLCFSQDKEILLSSSLDGDIRIWYLRNLINLEKKLLEALDQEYFNDLTIHFKI